MFVYAAVTCCDAAWSNEGRYSAELGPQICLKCVLLTSLMTLNHLRRKGATGGQTDRHLCLWFFGFGLWHAVNLLAAINKKKVN